MVRPKRLCGGKIMKPVLAGVADKAARSTNQGRRTPTESIRARAFKSPVILPLFVGAAIASAAWPLLIGYAPFGHRATEQAEKSRRQISVPEIRVAAERIEGGSDRLASPTRASVVVVGRSAAQWER